MNNNTIILNQWLSGHFGETIIQQLCRLSASMVLKKFRLCVGWYYANNQYKIYNDYSANLKQWTNVNHYSWSQMVMFVVYVSINLCSPLRHLLVGHHMYNASTIKKKRNYTFYCTFDKFATRYSQLLATPSLIFWILMLVQCFTNPDLVHQLTQSKQWLRGRVKFLPLHKARENTSFRFE